MNAERSVIINDTKISEYWWAGKMVVYIDNCASELSFENACEAVKNKEKNAIRMMSIISKNA